MRILAVDDDENIRELLSASISAETSHNIVTVPSAQKALAATRWEEQKFDCFLLDIQMPGMDGIELAQHLRAQDSYKAAPILMLTAMAQKKFIDRAFQAGATDYITKPFEFLELFSRLTNAERLIAEQDRLNRRRAEISALKHDLARSYDHSLSEPVELLGIERMVGYVSFENYLLQLSRMKLMMSSVVAVKILNVQKVFRNMDRGLFRSVLQEVGGLLAAAFDSNEDIITYRGNGVFAVATSSRTAFSQFALEKDLNRKIRELPAVRLARSNVQVCAGEPVSLLSLTRAGSLNSLQNAVARAEARADSYHDILQMSARVARRGSTEGEAPQNRRAYEALLQQELQEKQVAKG